MKWIFAATGVMTLLLGCTSVIPPEGPEPDRPDPSFKCDAGPAQSLIGQPATSELAADAQRLSGAALVRWLQPGQIVTMEFREDRLNIQLDAQNRVVAIRCG